MTDDQLDADQAQAAGLLTGFLSIVAGPGSGKTRVLVARVVAMIREHGVAPGTILLFSFTRSACAELRERLAEALPEAESLSVTVTTFHAWALRLLREWRPRGWPEAFTVLEPPVAEGIARSMWSGQGHPKRSEGKRVRWTDWSAQLEHYHATGNAPENPDARTLLDVFESRMAWAGGVTFGQLVVEANRALQHANVQEWAQRWRHVLVDEAHDMTPAEGELVYRLSSWSSLTLVQDPRQQVYAWRGATGWPGYEEPSFEVYLPASYRFGPRIAQVATAIQEATWGDLYHPIVSAGDRESSDVVRVAACAEHVRHELAASEALDAAELYGRGNVAVLCRTNAECRSMAFTLGELAVHVTRGTDPLAEDLRVALATARLAVNNADDDAFVTVWNADREAKARESWLPMRRVKAEAGQRAHLYATWLRLLQAQEAIAPSTSWASPLGLVGTWGSHKQGTFAAWCLALARMRAIPTPDLEALVACGLADATLPEALDAWNTRDDADAFESARAEDRIQLATIHASKGREWPAVVVLLSDGVQTRFPRDLDAYPEDWRCLFVAVTRAQERLSIIGHNPRTTPLWVQE